MRATESRIRGVGGEVVEPYDAFVLARLSDRQVAALEHYNLHVRSLPDRDWFGRGAFFFRAGDGDSGIPESLRLSAPAIGALGYFVVHFVGPLKESWTRTLEGVGIEFLEPLPNFGYVVRGPAEFLQSWRRHTVLDFVGLYHTGYRLDPSLLDAEGWRMVALRLYDSANVESVVERLIAAGAEVELRALDSLGYRVYARVDARTLVGIAQEPGIAWIEPSEIGGPPERFVDNDQVRWVTQSGTQNFVPLHDRNIGGQNQVVVVADTGLRYTHEQFDHPGVTVVCGRWPVNPTIGHRKISLYYFINEGGVDLGDCVDGDGHGTHVSGIVAGDSGTPDSNCGGGTWYTWNERDGNAFQGKLIFNDIQGPSGFRIPADYEAFYGPAYDNGARFSTNSWGSPHTQSYTSASQSNDLFSWNHRDFLIFRSMGNLDYQANRMRPEAVAKNVVSVGATGNGLSHQDMASFSSRGDTNDGRVKPTVVAPGVSVYSASLSACGYVPISGTSMATPAAAAATALVRQYFVDGWYPTGTQVAANGFQPSAALLRAALVNGATEINGVGSHDHQYCRPGLAYCFSFPNEDQGWGEIRLWDSLYFADGTPSETKRIRLFVVDETGGLASGQTAEYSIHVSDTSRPLRVTLAWTDFPGTPGSAKDQVNDLDLSVTSPTGAEYKGNVFCQPPCSTWGSVTGGTPDDRNVEEKVHVNSPALGIWKISVTATNVDPIHGRQPFALAVTGYLSDETRQTYTSTSPIEPTIVVDNSRNAHIAFTQNDAGNWNIYYTKVDPDGRVLIEDTLIPANDADGTEQFAPALTIDSSGNLYLFFADEHCDPNCNTPVTRTYFLEGWKSSNGGASWTDLNLALFRGYVFLSTVGSSLIDRSKPIQATADSAGRVHLMWQALVTGEPQEAEYLLYARTDDGALSWVVWPGCGCTSQALITDSYTTPDLNHYNRIRFPKIAVGTPGYVHSIHSYDPENHPYPGPPYCQTSCGTWVRYLSSSDSGNNWAAAVSSSWVTVDLGRENTLAADSVGNVYAAWNDVAKFPVDGIDVWFVRSSDNGLTWTQQPEVVAGGLYTQKIPWLAVDPGRAVHITWLDMGAAGGASCDVRRRTSVDNGVTWNTARAINLVYGRASSLGCNHLVSTSDNLGVLHIAWERGGAEGGQDGIYYATAPRDRPVSQISQGSGKPSAAVDAAGRTHVVWIDNRAGDGDFTGFARDGSNRLYALKHGGTVLRSPNGGVSWLYRGKVPSGTSDTFIGADSDRTTKTVALAEFGRGYESTDGGTTWTYRSDIANRIDFRDLDIQTNTATYYVIAADGQVYRSTDGGATWSAYTDASIDATFISIEADTAPVLYALTRGSASEPPRVYRWDGALWSLDVTFGASLRFFCSESTPSGDIFALAETGEVYRRSGPGSWSLMGDVGMDSDYRRLVSDSTGTLYVLRQSGVAFASTDGGASWSKKGDAGLDNEVYYAQLDFNGLRARADGLVTTTADNSDGIDQFGSVVVLRSSSVYAFWANLHIDDSIPGQIIYDLDGARSDDNGATWIEITTVPGTVFQSDGRTMVDKGDPIDVAVDASGGIHIVFRQHVISIAANTESDTLLYTRSLDGGTTWLLPITIWTETYPYQTGDHVDKINYPHIAAGEPNHIHVILSHDPNRGPIPGPPWCDPGLPDCPNTYIRYGRSTDNGLTWTPQAQIQAIGTSRDNARESALRADVVRGPSEGVYAVWHDWDGADEFDIFFARSINGGNQWEPATQVISGPGYQTYPALALDANGVTHLAWADRLSEGGTLNYELFHRLTLNAYQPGTPTWLNSRRLTYAPGNSIRPYLALDSGRSIHAVWMDDRLVPVGSAEANRWYDIYYLTWL